MFELLGLLFQKDMIPTLYISILSNLYAEYNSTGSKKMDLTAFQEKFDLQKSDKTNNPSGDQIAEKMGLFDPKVQTIPNSGIGLVSFDYQAERYVNKSFGYSLVDLEGNFIWADDNSQRLFEIKVNYEKGIHGNFFDLMIPQSKFYIKNKYGESIFNNQSNPNNSVCFSYVIFSKKTMDKYLKHLRKTTGKKKGKDGKLPKEGTVHGSAKNSENKLKKEDAGEDSNFEAMPYFASSTEAQGLGAKREFLEKNPDELNDEIFYKYLRPLSSKLTLIALTFTKREFQEIIGQKDYKINFHSSLCDEIQQKSDLPPAEESQIVKYAILLETRLCSKKPDLHYYLLKDHPRIQEFNSIVNQKVNKLNMKEHDLLAKDKETLPTDKAPDSKTKDLPKNSEDKNLSIFDTPNKPEDPKPCGVAIDTDMKLEAVSLIP